MYDVGRVCLKTAGREAGKYCVIVKKIDEKFVMVTGPREVTQVKRRRCNVNHLEPLQETIQIKSDAPDSEVAKAFQASSVVTKLSIEPRKAHREKKKPKAEKKEDAKAEKPREKKETKAKPEKKPAKK